MTIITNEEYTKKLLLTSIRGDVVKFSKLLNQIPSNQIDIILKNIFPAAADPGHYKSEQILLIMLDKNDNKENMLQAIYYYCFIIKFDENIRESNPSSINPEIITRRIKNSQNLLQLLINRIDPNYFSRLHQDTKTFIANKIQMAPKEWLDDNSLRPTKIIELPPAIAPDTTNPIETHQATNTIYLNNFYFEFFTKQFQLHKINNLKIKIEKHFFNTDNLWELTVIVTKNKTKRKFSFKLLPKDNLVEIYNHKNWPIHQNIELENSPSLIIAYIYQKLTKK
jgi:hypothetical protein